MQGNQVRVALVGCGKIAAIHAKALDALPEADFVACCDREISRAADLAARYGVPHVSDDVVDLFRSGLVDAALVCTPHPAHEAVVVAAAEAGVHVLCEKPIATTLGEADRMIAAADRAGIKFGVIFQRRFWPSVQRIRAAIDAGKIGTPILGECAVRLWRGPDYFAMDPWRGKWATEGGGVLMNQAVHSIDHFQWFMGRAVEVSGRIATLRHGGYIDVEDTAVATVRFESGALGVIQASSTFQPAYGFRVAVNGDSGATISVWERNEGELGSTTSGVSPAKRNYASSGWPRTTARKASPTTTSSRSRSSCSQSWPTAIRRSPVPKPANRSRSSSPSTNPAAPASPSPSQCLPPVELPSGTLLT